jgi:hypothetical protein
MAPRDLNRCSKALKRVLSNGRRPVGIYLTNDQINEIYNKNRVHSDGIWFLIGKTEFEGKTRKTVELIPFNFDTNGIPQVTKINDHEGKIDSIHESFLNNNSEPNFAKEVENQKKDLVIFVGTIPGQRTPPPRTI